LDIQQTLEAAGATLSSFAATMREQRGGSNYVGCCAGRQFGRHSGSFDIDRAWPRADQIGTPDQFDGCPSQGVIEKPFDVGKLASIFRVCTLL
jgi:hypothetical protein